MKAISISFFLFYLYHIENYIPASEIKINTETANLSKQIPRVYYGTASYYADKFDGRETASGEIYDHTKMTAACNILPLGTWIRVTNMSNNRAVIVHTNDRLHIRMKRLVDLSRSAAEYLGYIKKGLTLVKVEVLQKHEREAINNMNK